MKQTIKQYKLLIIIPFIVCVLCFFMFVPWRTAVVFYKENTSHIEAFLPIGEEDTFQIIWTHSIHLTDVVEKYKVMKDHEIKQYEIVYEHFGIGMPSNAGEGESFVFEDGKYHIKGIDTIFPTMKIRNGKTVSKHRLVWGTNDENMVKFNDYFEPGAWFTIKVDHLSLWQYLRGVKIYE